MMEALRAPGAFEAGAEGSAASPPAVVTFDARGPQLLAGRGCAIQVTAGYVDIFAVKFTECSGEGARHHLFRVGAGEWILDLPETDDGLPERVRFVPVAGSGAQALLLPRSQIESPDAITTWITRLEAAIIGRDADWTIPEAESDKIAEIAQGERRRGSARGIVWVSVTAGGIQVMGGAPLYEPVSPPLPLTSGLWLEAAESPTVIACSGRAPGGDDLWRAIDQFHVCATECIRRRMALEVGREVQRLARRTQLASTSAHQTFEDLTGLIAPPRGGPRSSAIADDPLFAACRMVGDAIGANVVRPPRTPTLQEFSDVVEIAQASRLRIRRTLLRADWWRQDAGPLVAWHGEARRPVALVPISRHRYLMIDPGSGIRRVVDESVAAELAPEAAMFYPTLPSRSLSFWELLSLSVHRPRADAVRVLVSFLALGLLTLAAPFITQVIVNSVIPRTELDQLTYCAAALVVTALAMASLQLMQGAAVLRLEGLLNWRMQASIMDRLLRLPASLFREYTVGDLSDRTLGIDAVRRMVTGTALRGLLAGFLCWFSLLLMFYYDLHLALIATALISVRAVLIIVVSGVRLYHEQQHFNLQGGVQGLVLQLLAGVGKLRVAAATVRALAVWAKRFAAQKRHFIASQRAANVLAVAETSLPTVATLLIFAAAEGPSATGLKLDLGAFLAFFTAFGQALASVGEWATALGSTVIAVPHVSRIRPLLSTPAEVPDGHKPAGELSGSVELSRVTFRYVPGGPPTLDDVSLRVESGEYVAIVGPSGSGKSTTFRLLLGFERPEAGAIFFDGKAIDTLDIGTVRRQLGVVLQNGRIGSGSIYEIICGGTQLPMDQVWEATRLAGLEADVRAMPMELHTVIAEGASTLSGGQRQRLMIARAIVRRPRILLFDEATSALDNQAQAVVSASLGRLNVTRIVIAHRLSTVREADRIIVFVDGKIVQAGSFTELTAAPGIFVDFAKRQLL